MTILVGGQAPLTSAQMAARLAPIVVTGNVTATINRVHIVTTTATLTDPTPAEGAGYEVIIRNATGTVGGTAYGVGLKIRRYYHSGAWSNQVEPSWGGTPTSTRLTEWDSTGNLINSAITDGVSGGVLTLSAALAGNVTVTFPPSSITVAGSASALTSGRVPFATTGGLLTDSSGFTVSGNILTCVGIVASNASEGNAYLGIITGDTVGRFLVTHAGAISWGPGNAARDTNLYRAAANELKTDDAFTAVGTVTVPNGTAAAPGLRLTSEASGLYRVSSTSLGFAVAGTAAASLTSAGAFAATTLSAGTAVGGFALTVNGTTRYRNGADSRYRSDLSVGAAGLAINAYDDTGTVYLPLTYSASQFALQIDASATNRVYVTGTAPGTPASTEVLIGAGAMKLGATTASTSTTTGAQTVAGGLGVAGQTTTRREAYAVATISTTGAIASLASDDGFTRLTGAAPDVQGIANSGTVARRLVLYCVNATTLRHENGTAAAADRITSDTAADIAVTAGKTVELIYDPTSSRWRPIRY